MLIIVVYFLCQKRCSGVHWYTRGAPSNHFVIESGTIDWKASCSLFSAKFFKYLPRGLPIALLPLCLSSTTGLNLVLGHTSGLHSYWYGFVLHGLGLSRLADRSSKGPAEKQQSSLSYRHHSSGVPEYYRQAEAQQAVSSSQSVFVMSTDLDGCLRARCSQWRVWAVGRCSIGYYPKLHHLFCHIFSAYVAE